MPHLVSFVVVNYNGAETLDPCVRSIIVQDFPRSDRSIVVVDNASTDGSLQQVETHPGIRIIRNSRNTGFAAAANQGAEAAEGEYVAFINSDAHLHRSWLKRMLDGMRKARADCVTSRIDSWDGKETQSDGAVVSFLGHCWEVPRRKKRKRPWVLFPHGAAMLMRRETFLDVGGFDPKYFAYFEDVDFGWRLNLLGHRVALVPEAVAFHQGQGAAGKISFAQRLLLYERNALMTIYKNYDEENLERILPAAILLTLGRAFARADLDPGEYELNGDSPLKPERIPRAATATLLAVEEFMERLEELQEQRAAIQEKRKRSDREILRLFGDPFRAHEMGKEYGGAFKGAVDLFGVREVFKA